MVKILVIAGMTLPIEPRDKIPAGLGADKGLISLMESWFDSFDESEKEVIKQLTGFAINLVDFSIPTGFFKAFLTFWDHRRHVLRLAATEMMPSLEEYSRLSGIKLDGSCARVFPGTMLDSFLTLLGLRKKAVEPKLDQGCILPIRYLIHRFFLEEYFIKYGGEFNIGIDQWKHVRVDAFLVCLTSMVYLPQGPSRFNIGVATIVTEMKMGRTIIPLLIAETISSLSNCKINPGSCFKGSPALLYIWTMGHLTPSTQSRRKGYWFINDFSEEYRVRPRFCTDEKKWRTFFTLVKTKDVIMYTGWCSPQTFLLKVPGLNFIPLVGMKVMVSYFASAIAAQFDRYQDIPNLEEEKEFRGAITKAKIKFLRAAYDLWDKRIFYVLDPSEPIHKFSLRYSNWLDKQMDAWEMAEEPMLEPPPQEESEKVMDLTVKIETLNNELATVTAERDLARSVIQNLQKNVELVAATTGAFPPEASVICTSLLDWVHQSLNMPI